MSEKTKMNPEFREYLVEGGLTDQTMDALQKIGVTNKESMKSLSDSDVDDLQLAEPSAKVQKKTVKRMLKNLTAAPAPGTYVVSGADLTAGTVKKDGKFGAMHVAGANASKLAGRVTDTKMKVDTVEGEAFIQDFSEDKKPEEQPVKEPEGQADMETEDKEYRETLKNLQ